MPSWWAKRMRFSFPGPGGPLDVTIRHWSDADEVGGLSSESASGAVRTDEGEGFVVPRWEAGLATWDDQIPRVLAARLLPLAPTRVLAVPCGAGLEAITAALAGHETVALDLDPRAVALARENAAANGATVETALFDACDVDGFGKHFGAGFGLVVVSELINFSGSRTVGQKRDEQQQSAVACAFELARRYGTDDVMILSAEFASDRSQWRWAQTGFLNGFVRVDQVDASRVGGNPHLAPELELWVRAAPSRMAAVRQL